MSEHGTPPGGSLPPGPAYPLQGERGTPEREGAYWRARLAQASATPGPRILDADAAEYDVLRAARAYTAAWVHALDPAARRRDDATLARARAALLRAAAAWAGVQAAAETARAGPAPDPETPPRVEPDAVYRARRQPGGEAP